MQELLNSGMMERVLGVSVRVGGGGSEAGRPEGGEGGGMGAWGVVSIAIIHVTRELYI